MAILSHIGEVGHLCLFLLSSGFVRIIYSHVQQTMLFAMPAEDKIISFSPFTK